METIDQVRHIQAILAMSAATTVVYKSWDDAFCRKQIAGDVERILHGNKSMGVPGIGRVNVQLLSDDEAAILGFNSWSDEDGDPLRGMRMVPLYLYPFLAYGQELTCIDGTTKVVMPGYNDPTPTNINRDAYKAGPWIDADHRGGSIAYGFIPTVKSHLTAEQATEAAREIIGDIVTSDGQRMIGVVAVEKG